MAYFYDGLLAQSIPDHPKLIQLQGMQILTLNIATRLPCILTFASASKAFTEAHDLSQKLERNNNISGAEVVHITTRLPGFTKLVGRPKSRHWATVYYPVRTAFSTSVPYGEL